MTSCELPRIRIDSAGDLIEAVPYLIGFHPSESLVMVGFAGGELTRPQQVTVTVRVDLDDDQRWPELAEALEQSGAEAVVLLALTEDFEGDPRRCERLAVLCGGIGERMRDSRLEVLDCLVVNATHWWSMRCVRVECCPPQGTPRRLGCSAAAAQATFAGLVAMPDRQALEASLSGAGGAERDALEPALEAAENRLTKALLNHGAQRMRKTEITALLAAARRLADADAALFDPPVLTGKPALTDRQVTRFGVALSDIGVRDALWLAVDDKSIESLALWRQLHSRLPAPYDAAPLFLFGWSHWRAGNGTLATMAAERALQSDPGYSAAMLLLSAVQRGLDPRKTPALSEPDRLAARR